MFVFRPYCMAQLPGNGPRSSHEVRFSLAATHPQGACVHNGGITTSGKPLAMYGADDPPYGKSRVNCQVPRPACPSPPTARLTRRLEPPPSCRSVADALY